MLKLTAKEFHPFIRCVGLAENLRQTTTHMAYDYRMIIALNGSGQILLNKAAERLKEGDSCIIPPGMGYRVMCGENQQIIVINFDWTHNNCHINKPVLSTAKARFKKDAIIEACDLSCFFQENDCVLKFVLKDELRLCEKILLEYKKLETKTKDIRLSYLFMQLISGIISREGGGRASDIAREIYGYITENYSGNISLIKVAEAFHFHPTYVNRLLKKHYGISFKQLVLKCRFDRAIYLIDNFDLSVKEIAKEVGFSDAQYFSNAFYKYFGYYPTHHKK